MADHSHSEEDTSCETDSELPSIVSTPQQVLTGVQIGLPDLHASCTCCGESITEGQACTVYAYRPANGQEWYPAKCYCQGCAPDKIPTPTIGTSEVVIQSWLGVVSRPHDRSHRLCLLEVELVEFSPPTEGRQP